MFIQSIPCGQIPQYPANGQATWNRQVGLGCVATCAGVPVVGCGMGLFDSGFDPTTWGIGEWATVLGGLYVVFAVFSTTKRGVSAVAEIPGKRRRRRAAALEDQAAKLRGRKATRRKEAWA